MANPMLAARVADRRAARQRPSVRAAVSARRRGALRPVRPPYNESR